MRCNVAVSEEQTENFLNSVQKC